MKVTNDLIDKVTEVSLDVAKRGGITWEAEIWNFLNIYLPARSLKDAKKKYSFEEWKAAYIRYHTDKFGAPPPGGPSP